ncbi:helix-turn-helix domain-containing protein [Bacillaceae bacterium W0354]
MIDNWDRDQEKLWDSVQTLSGVDDDQAKAVFKAVIERSLRQIGFFTSYIHNIPLKLPSKECIQLLKDLDKQIKKKIEHEDGQAFELLVEYIDELSNLAEADSKVTRKKWLASIIKDSCQQQNNPSKTRNREYPVPSFEVKESPPAYYTPNEVARRLGVSDQTVRRMCDKGKFPGSYQTDGGHWKIPIEALITSEEKSEAERHDFTY